MSFFCGPSRQGFSEASEREFWGFTWTPVPTNNAAKICHAVSLLPKKNPTAFAVGRQSQNQFLLSEPRTLTIL